VAAHANRDCHHAFSSFSSLLSSISSSLLFSSIFHTISGEDAMSGELAQEKWLPMQSMTTIVLSLLSPQRSQLLLFCQC
jgi:hypothetical protein